MEEDRFQGISRNLAGRIKPAIMETVQEEDGDGFRATNIDSRYRNSIIGMNMMFLDEADIVRTDEKTSRGNVYYVVGSVEPAVEAAKQVYRYKIIDGLSRTQENSVEVVEDLETFAEFDNIDEEKLPNYRGDLEYHRQTEWLFDRLNLIDNPEDRNFTADKSDIQYLVENRDEWKLIAEALATGEGLPKQYIEKMEDYERRFPSESYDTGQVWTEEDLDRVRR